MLRFPINGWSPKDSSESEGTRRRRRRARQLVTLAAEAFAVDLEETDSEDLDGEFEDLEGFFGDDAGYNGF